MVATKIVETLVRATLKHQFKARFSIEAFEVGGGVGIKIKVLSTPCGQILTRSSKGRVALRQEAAAFLEKVKATALKAMPAPKTWVGIWFDDALRDACLGALNESESLEN
jgi:hypothetical protein